MPNIETTENFNSSAQATAKMADEVNQSRMRVPCPNAVTSGRDLYEFGRGAIHGAVESADSFIEFMSKPYAVTDALVGVGPVLDTAVDYYSEKLTQGRVKDVIHDAGSVAASVESWLKKYSQSLPEVRGQTCGRMVADLVLIEAGASITRGAMAASEGRFASSLLESRSPDFERFVADFEKTEGVGFKQIRRFGASRPFAEQVDKILQKAPERVRQFLKENGVEVVPVRNLDALGADCASALGLYVPSERVIFIAEEPNVAWVESGFGNAQRTNLTISHEIGHAIDHLTRENEWLSSSAAIRGAFDKDYAAMPRQLQEVCLRDFGRGSIGRLRKEMFAELFSHADVPTADPLIRNFVFGHFPRMYKTMSEVEECIVRRLRTQT